jgi:eukaryotic-like serine/threonine-protein kinase
MAKVFTITEGLENLGAIKTGGQGSVYKGKRVGEIITAVKLLPTPIQSEDLNDKNYRDFNNEVEKLKTVNEEPNANVVRILSSGITETGCLPFIEMEYIEGPDLGEILKPPHDKIFTIQESIKVAVHLSNALAHCHKHDVKHGDIKSNNVKLNIHTGNYMLLDFGLAVMTDEDRRTSLRHAGAIEFMAPEQNSGLTFFQTDVYSFGVILFELLAGRVPFPLKDSGETARNAVMVSHLETPPPDFLKLRQQHLPRKWSREKKDFEMNVPEWLITIIYKCLEKKPEDRFKDGKELHEYILNHNIFLPTQYYSENVTAAATVPDELEEELERLKRENERLHEQISFYQSVSDPQPKKVVPTPVAPVRKQTVSRAAFVSVLFIAIALAGLAFYSTILHPLRSPGAVTTQEASDTLMNTDSSLLSKKPMPNVSHVSKKKEPVKDETVDSTTSVKQFTPEMQNNSTEVPTSPAPVHPKKKKAPVEDQSTPENTDSSSTDHKSNQQVNGDHNDFSMNFNGKSKQYFNGSISPISQER